MTVRNTGSIVLVLTFKPIETGFEVIIYKMLTEGGGGGVRVVRLTNS